jgi:predicted dienelactone hydrolase
VTDGAAAAEGRFPMVVYSHGVFSSGMERHEALARWVGAGYVVVAPTFPLSSRPSIEVTDLPNQPGDVEFVAETFRSEVQNPEHPLYDRVLIDCLALAGHSLGGATTLAAAFDPCCGASDPTAVIDIAGVAVNITPGASFADADPLPTLIVHGVRDAVVPYAQSETVFSTLAGPRWFVTITEGQHSSMFDPPEVEVLTESVVAFLDAQLKGSPGALEALPAAVDASGIATLQVAGAS